MLGLSLRCNLRLVLKLSIDFPRLPIKRPVSSTSETTLLCEKRQTTRLGDSYGFSHFRILSLNPSGFLPALFIRT